MRNRGTHVRIAQFRQNRAVDILDQGMNHALRMNDDLDPARRHIEQPMCLDHFQPLIHHCRGINRDFPPHAPVRMRTGLIGSHYIEVTKRRAAKRATGRCQQDTRNTALARPASIVGRKRLENGIVFTVDRQQHGAVLANRSHEDGASHDQRLLVGQEDPLSGNRRRQRRRQASRANDRGHDRVNLGQLGHAHEGVRAKLDTRRT